jgi:hypothetical protein
MKEKNLLKKQPLPKVLRVHAIRSKQLRSIYLLHRHGAIRTLLLITGQNEREETTGTQDAIVTKSAACASYKSNYVTYISATYRTLLLVKMKEKKLLKMQSFPKVLLAQAIRNIYNCPATKKIICIAGQN